jgi:hypothetical protein
MAKRKLSVFLPESWYEVPDQQPRLFQRRVEGSGTLSISLHPPEGLQHKKDGRVLIARLHDILRATKMELGAHLSSEFGPCSEGTMAWSTWRSSHYGLMKFWLIPAERHVFGVFKSGPDAEEADREAADAHAILESAHFSDTDE